jgi:uroporphyrinogen decarboxylase
MPSKELLFSVFRHETTPQVPWVPFAGVHAGKLKGYSGQEMLTDADKLFDSLMEVHRVYDPDGMPITFDLQIEAEILGCELVWAKDAPPSVVGHPLADNLTIPTYIPQPSDGRLPLVLDVMARMKTAVGAQTALYGLVTGPLTLASHLRGTEIFMDTFDRPDFLVDLLAYCTQVGLAVADYFIEAGMDVIAVVDPVVSQVSPRMFKQYLHTPFQTLFDAVRARGVFSSFFVCGDATKNIEVMCATAPDCISIDENIDMVTAKQITDAHNIAIAGNIPLSTIMLNGTQQDTMKYVVDLMHCVSHHNLIISPGCDMPYDTPVENTIGAMEAVRDHERIHALVQNYTSSLDDIEVEMPDYAHLEKPLVEVFTIDSATCAACGYMTAVAKQVVGSFEGRVEFVERKSTERENIARIKKLGFAHLPSICINGELVYSSNIPNAGEFKQRLQACLED